MQKCQLLKKCGLLPGGVGKCAGQECPLWPPGQSLCLTNLICFPPPTPDICQLVQKCVVTPQKPDLVITGFKAAVAGSTVTYAVTTCNKGKGPAQSFFVDLYYDRPTAPGSKQYGNQYKSYTGLAAGACDTATFTRTNTPGGTYTSWAQVDADGKVTETSEQNNVEGPVKVTVGGPPPPPPPTGADLVIKSMETSLFGSISVTVRYKLVVCNNGTDPSAGSQVHVYYNRKTAPPQGFPGDKFTTVPGLKPGGCTTRSIYRSGTPQGSYTSWAQVDPYNQVQESNETNNTAGPVKVNVGSSPGADLTIKTFDHQVYGASTVRYRVQVCNVGTGSSATADVHVYFNRPTKPTANAPGDQFTTVPMLAAGKCANRYVNRSGTPPGTFNSWAQVDPYDQIKETNETNNVAGPIKVTVGSTTQKPDLLFKSFDAKVLQSPIGTASIQYSMVVCNAGKGPASAFRVDVYYNRSNPPKTFQLGNTHQNLVYLGPGGCTTINRYRPNPKPGSYTSWAQVDTTQNVVETDESNNVAGPRKLVVGSTTSCNAICGFAVACGVFQPTQLSQCMTWCNGLDPTAKQCVTQATQSGSCTDFNSCSTPPPPPPPPPPGVCPDLCNYIINTCKFIPSSQYWACIGACENLTPDKVKCAQDAKAKNQCMQLVTCML